MLTAVVRAVCLGVRAHGRFVGGGPAAVGLEGR